MGRRAGGWVWVGLVGMRREMVSLVLLLFSSLLFRLVFTRNCIYMGRRGKMGYAFFSLAWRFPVVTTWKRRVVPDLGLGELLLFSVSGFDGEKRDASPGLATAKTAEL